MNLLQPPRARLLPRDPIVLILQPRRKVPIVRPVRVERRAVRPHAAHRAVAEPGLEPEPSLGLVAELRHHLPGRPRSTSVSVVLRRDRDPQAPSHCTRRRLCCQANTIIQVIRSQPVARGCARVQRHCVVLVLPDLRPDVVHEHAKPPRFAGVRLHPRGLRTLLRGHPAAHMLHGDSRACQAWS